MDLHAVFPAPLQARRDLVSLLLHPIGHRKHLALIIRQSSPQHIGYNGIEPMLSQPLDGLLPAPIPHAVRRMDPYGPKLALLGGLSVRIRLQRAVSSLDRPGDRIQVLLLIGRLLRLGLQRSGTSQTSLGLLNSDPLLLRLFHRPLKRIQILIDRHPSHTPDRGACTSLPHSRQKMSDQRHQHLPFRVRIVPQKNMRHIHAVRRQHQRRIACLLPLPIPPGPHHPRGIRNRLHHEDIPRVLLHALRKPLETFASERDLRKLTFVFPAKIPHRTHPQQLGDPFVQHVEYEELPFPFDERDDPIQRFLRPLRIVRENRQIVVCQPSCFHVRLAQCIVLDPPTLQTDLYRFGVFPLHQSHVRTERQRTPQHSEHHTPYKQPTALHDSLLILCSCHRAHRTAAEEQKRSWGESSPPAPLLPCPPAGVLWVLCALCGLVMVS